MEFSGFGMSGTDFGLLNNSKNIDKFRKRFMAQTNMTYIIYLISYNI